MLIKNALANGWQSFNQCFIWLIPLADLIARVGVANVFFFSGWVKIIHWDTTLLLFSQEYAVPLLSPTLAAALGSTIEVVAPIFLVLGLGGRLPALILFVFNCVAVISYPHLWTEVGQMGLMDHLYWGILLMMLMCYGPSKLSLDHLIYKLYSSRSL